MSSISSGGRQLYADFFKLLNANSGLKCKCDLIVKNSIKRLCGIILNLQDETA